MSKLLLRITGDCLHVNEGAGVVVSGYALPREEVCQVVDALPG